MVKPTPLSESETWLRHQQYVFDLPSKLLNSLEHIPIANTLINHQEEEPQAHPLDEPEAEPEPQNTETNGNDQAAATCSLCHASFPSQDLRRQHVKSDWHQYNLQQRRDFVPAVSEETFKTLLEDLDSESSESSDDDAGPENGSQGESMLARLLKKQARIREEEEAQSTLDQTEAETKIKKRKLANGGAAPIYWATSQLLPTDARLGFYKGLLSASAPDPFDVLRQRQLGSVPSSSKPAAKLSAAQIQSEAPSIFMCMIGGGYFAANIVSLKPKLVINNRGLEERQPVVLAHKGFQRYTTRRKQGGSQSANDNAKGNAHSAGAGIRRANEVMLETEVRALLHDWREMISKCDLLFIRASGTSNRRVLFGPYEGQVLRSDDPRLRTFPFNTRRATSTELLRAFSELTTLKVMRIDERALEAAAQSERAKEAAAAEKAAEKGSSVAAPKFSKEEEENLLHTTQLQALIRRSKAPAVVAYLASNAVSPDFVFYPPDAGTNHHAPTPLHLAASLNSPAVVSSLLLKAEADPTKFNQEGKPAYDLAGDRPTRDAFRVARHTLGEDAFSWKDAHVPSPISKAEADERGAAEKREADRIEQERRRVEEERLAKLAPANGPKKPGRTLASTVEATPQEKRDQESRGLTPEVRAKIERERRARAAEERMKKLSGK